MVLVCVHVSFTTFTCKRIGEVGNRVANALGNNTKKSEKIDSLTIFRLCPHHYCTLLSLAGSWQAGRRGASHLNCVHFDLLPLS